MVKLSERCMLDDFVAWLRANHEDRDKSLLETAERVLVEMAFLRWGKTKRALEGVAEELLMTQPTTDARRLAVHRLARKHGIIWEGSRR